MSVLLQVSHWAGAQTPPSPSNVTPVNLPSGTGLSPEREMLLKKVDKALFATSMRRLTAGEYTPWQIVHGVLAFKHDLILKNPKGGTISGLEWLASGAIHDGEPLFERTPYGGRGHVFTRPYAFEGHPTQFMGYMSMCDLPLDFRFKTGASGEITVRDIINDAKMQIQEGPEVTWTLWALAHYLPPDAEWINARGEAWSIERMVQIQTHESVYSGACGGTHGLFALAYARNRYIATRRPLRGIWIEADMKIRRFVNEAKALQNPDGSFSSNYFQGPGHSTDFVARIPANGHMLEWLMVALPQNELQADWIQRAADSVASDLLNNRKTKVDCGPLFHAVHSLVLFNFRMNPNARPLAYPLTGKGKLETQLTGQVVPKRPVPDVPKAATQIPPQHNKTVGIPDIPNSDDDKTTGDLEVPNPPKEAPKPGTPQATTPTPQG